MDARERYFWDLTGYLVVRNVLTGEELSACNAAIDHCMERMQQSPDNGGARDSTALQGTGQQTLPNLLELPHPHCEPFRRLLVHPQVVCRLNTMCGKGFRHDHGPWVSYSPKGTEGLILHGAGEPHRPYVAYHHQNGQFHCAGVTVTWQLADCKAGDGGFACVPGSHKAKFPMPAGVRSCDEPMDVVHQPALKAGDVIFFMDGAQTHGTPTLEKRCAASRCPLQVREPHGHPYWHLQRVSRAGSLLGRGYRRRYDARATRRHVRPLFQYRQGAAFAGRCRRQRRARQVSY